MDDRLKKVAAVAACTAGVYFVYRACCHTEPNCSTPYCSQNAIRLRGKGKSKTQSDLQEILKEASAISGPLTCGGQNGQDGSSAEDEYEICYGVTSSNVEVKGDGTERPAAVDDAEVELRRRPLTEFLSSAPSSVASAVRDRASQLRSSVASLFARRPGSAVECEDREDTLDSSAQLPTESMDETDSESRNQSRFWVFHKFRVPRFSWNFRNTDAGSSEQTTESQEVQEVVLVQENATSNEATKSSPESQTLRSESVSVTKPSKSSEKLAEQIDVKQVPSSAASSDTIEQKAVSTNATQQAPDTSVEADVRAKKESELAEKPAHHTVEKASPQSVQNANVGIQEQCDDSLQSAKAASSQKLAPKATLEEPSDATAKAEAATLSSNSASPAKAVEKATSNGGSQRNFGQSEAQQHTMQLAGSTQAFEAVPMAEADEMTSESFDEETMSTETSYRKISFEEYLLYLSISPPATECDRGELVIPVARDTVILNKKVRVGRAN